MKEALVGIETEYGINCDVARLKGLLGDANNYVNIALQQAGSVLPENDYCMVYKSTGEFWTRAGMRLYPDRGTHLEVATPECGTFGDLIFQKNVGDCLAQALVDSARGVLKEKHQYDGPFEIYANNTAVDSQRSLAEHPDSETVFARHENYLLRRDLLYEAAGIPVSFDYILENAGNFFAARPVLGGPGHISPKGEFILSPRMYWIAGTIGGGTTTNRTLVNTRDEPHADAQKFIRYHHIAGDTNITDHIARMKIAFTYWVLRLIERGWKAPQELRFDGTQGQEVSLLELGKRINGDMLLSKTHQLGGKALKAVDILSIYLDAVDKHRQNILFESEDEEIFQDVARFIDRAKGGFEELIGESEWATKYALMMEEMRKKKIEKFNHPLLKKLSIVLHNIDRNPRQNPFFLFRNKVLPPNMDIGNLVRACRKAPHTRAYARGLGIYLANRFGVAISFSSGAEWTCLSTPADPDGNQSTVCYLNRVTPWQVTKDDIERVVRHMKQVAMKHPKRKSDPGATDQLEPFYGV